jgi:DNA-binding transcriptional ArsR family regulator
MQIDPKRMKGAAAEASGLFAILSNPRRLMILCRLVDGEANVGELAAFCGGAQSSVSQHLALLRSSGLVTTRREAQTIYYQLASDPARGIMEAAYEAFCRPAKARAAARKQAGVKS